MIAVFLSRRPWLIAFTALLVFEGLKITSIDMITNNTIFDARKVIGCWCDCMYSVLGLIEHQQGRNAFIGGNFICVK